MLGIVFCVLAFLVVGFLATKFARPFIIAVTAATGAVRVTESLQGMWPQLAGQSDSGVADDSGPGGSRYDCTVRFHKKEEKIKEKKVSGENAPEAFSFSGIPGEIVKFSHNIGLLKKICYTEESSGGRGQ